MPKQQDIFRIYIDRLRDGDTEEFDQKVPPDFLDVCEEDLHFDDPVSFRGEAYFADGDLILHFFIATTATLPCSICNEPVKVPIEEFEFYHAEPVSEIKTGIFNFKELLREAVILEVPGFIECNNGNCPNRQNVSKYLKEEGGGDQVYHPFADLE